MVSAFKVFNDVTSRVPRICIGITKIAISVSTTKELPLRPLPLPLLPSLLSSLLLRVTSGFDNNQRQLADIFDSWYIKGHKYPRKLNIVEKLFVINALYCGM